MLRPSILGSLSRLATSATASAKAHEQIAADVRMRHLAAAEADRDLDTVAVGNEFLGVFQLGIEIAHVDTGGHTHFLDLDDVLVLSGFLFPLALLELVLAVVHQLAHGGHCLRRNFYQIKTGLVRDGQSLSNRNDAAVFSVLVN